MLTLSSACGGDKGTGPSNADPTGTYTLRSVDDHSLPATIHQGPWLDSVSVRFYNLYVVRVLQGSFSLDDDGRFYIAIGGQVNADGAVWSPTSSMQGDYQIEDGELWIKPDGLPVWPTPAQIHDGVIELPIDLMSKGVANVFEFRRS